MRAKALVVLFIFGLLFALLVAVARAGPIETEWAPGSLSLEAWSGFKPSGWVTSSPVTCTIEVQDGAGFIDQGEYQYRTGGDWSSWTAAGLQILQLDFSRRLLTVPSLSFSHSITEGANEIKFRIKSSLDEWLESSAYLVRVDTSAPTSTVSTSDCRTSLTQINGTASDSGSGVNLVEVTLQRAPDRFYYNGLSWQSELAWLVAAGTTPWSLPFVPSLETAYTVTSRATDVAGNVQGLPAVGAFTYDATAPTSSIGPAGYFSAASWPGALAGTASDGYYNGVTWGAAASWITASGTVSWSLAFAPTAETIYTATARAVDSCGNVQGPAGLPVSVFVYDATPPQSSITTAGYYRFGTWPGAITGTASDSVSGLATVQITLQRVSDGLYYNGAAWQLNAQWITVSGTSTWSWPFVPAAETAYTVTSRAVDRAGNVQGVPGVSAFAYDISSPQSTVGTIGYFNTWAGAISGSASDTFSGVANVQIQLQRSSDRFYYDGSVWGVAARWITVTGTVAWSLPFTPSVEAVYTVTSLATDNAGNVEIVPDTGVFVYDLTPPQTVVSTTGCFVAWPGAIIGTASDAVAGLDRVEVRVQRTVDGLYYNGSSWGPVETWIGLAGSANWSLPFPQPLETTYVVASRAVDRCGNMQIIPTSSGFTYDATAPQSTVESTGYFNSWGGVIQGTATDQASGVALVEIRLQRSVDSWYYNGSSWGAAPAWISATGTLAWSVPFTPTAEAVYAVTTRATDHCGNVQSVYGTGAFIYDRTSPQSEVATTGFFNHWAGFIEGTASDELSGLSAVQVTVQRASDGLYFDGLLWGPTRWITVSGTSPWSLSFVPPVETVYTVTSRAVDKAGNVQSLPSSGVFTWDITPPQAAVTTTGCFNAWEGRPLQGSAQDAVSGVAYVQVKVQRALDGYYYDGSSWVMAAQWVTVTGTTSWSLPFTPSAETFYTVTSAATDRCGNVQNIPGANAFTYDATAPQSEVLTTGYFNSWAGLVEGASTDGVSGVAAVEVTVQRAPDGFYYNGASWVAAAQWLTASGTTAWSLPFTPTAETVYTATSRASDHCGNVQSIPHSASIVYDVTPPSSPFNFSVTPSTWTPTNSFTVTWDSLPDLAGAVAAHFKWDSAPTSNADEAAASPVLGDSIDTISGIAVPVQGARQLFLWLEDKASNENFQTRNATSAGAFKWDAQPPATSVAAIDAQLGCSGWYVSAAQVSLLAVDVNPDPVHVNATSGISATFWRKNGDDWQLVVGSTFEVADQGAHTVEYYSVDVAGNSEAPHVLTPTIRIDSVPPTTFEPNYTGTLGRNGWYVSPVSVTLTAVDATAGVSLTYHQVDTDTVRAGQSFQVAGDGVHTLRYYSVDIACNQELAQTVTLKIDTTYPSTSYALEGRMGEGGWFVASPVTVSLTATDVVTGVQAHSGVDRVYYRIDGGSWQERPMTTSFTVAMPPGQSEYARTVEYYATDLAGNAEPIRVLTVRMDFHAPPAIPFAPYALPSGWSNTNCFNIFWYENPYDFSGIGGAYYSFHVPVAPTDGVLVQGDGLTSIPCVQVPAEVGDGLQNVYIWLRDKAGNSDHRARQTVTLALDRTPPAITPLVTGNLCDPLGWYNSPISVTLVATDSLSGMATGVISYQVNGGGWQQGAFFSQFNDGRYVVECRARDGAGNTSDIVTLTLRLDKTAPDAPDPVWVEPAEWSADGAFTVHWVNPWDLSGLAAVYYKQGSPPLSTTDGVYVDGIHSSFEISASAEGVVPVYVWLVDKACNADYQKRAMATLKYDHTPPTTTYVVSGTLGGDGWYTSAVLITLNCVDNHSGCGPDRSYYRIGDGPWQNGASFLIGGEGTTPFSFYSVDLAGNTGSTRSGSVKIDRTRPSSYAYSDSYSSSPSFTVRWDASDTGSGISSFDVQYRSGKVGDWQDWATFVDPLQKSKLFTGARGKAYYFRTRARDKAGNVELYPEAADTFVAVDPLINGDFERDYAPEWEVAAVCPPTRAYVQSYNGANTYAVVLGCPDQRNGAPVGESMLCQTINIPSAADMPAPMLRFRYRIFTYDVLWGPVTFKFYDSFNVGLWDPAELSPTHVFTDGNPGPDYGALLDMGWREGTVDLRPYAGRNMKVCLANVTRVDSSYNTWTIVDDARIANLEYRVCLPVVQRVAPGSELSVQGLQPTERRDSEPER